MRRLARYAPLLAIAASLTALVAPHLALAADTSFFGPIVPDICNCGTGAGWGCVLLVIKDVINFAITIGIFAAVAAIAYAGFLWILNPINAEYRKQASAMLLDSVVGLVITLAAFLIVNTLFTTLTNQTVTSVTAFLGQTSGNCLPAGGTGSGTYAGSTNGTTAGVVGQTVTGADPSANTRGDCTVSGLTTDGMDSSIASVMSCITKTEDTSCALGAKSGTDLADNGAGPSVSIGMFQVNISANNLSQYPACEAAVGNAPLNCTAAFTGGAYTASNHSTHLVNQNLYNTCVTAASNAQCNVQAAQDLYESHGGSGNWGTAAQQNCGG